MGGGRAGWIYSRRIHALGSEIGLRLGLRRFFFGGDAPKLSSNLMVYVFSQLHSNPCHAPQLLAVHVQSHANMSCASPRRVFGSRAPLGLRQSPIYPTHVVE